MPPTSHTLINTQYATARIPLLAPRDFPADSPRARDRALRAAVVLGGTIIGAGNPQFVVAGGGGRRRVGVVV